eukprot:g58141.t1
MPPGRTTRATAHVPSSSSGRTNTNRPATRAATKKTAGATSRPATIVQTKSTTPLRQTRQPLRDKKTKEAADISSSWLTLLALLLLAVGMISWFGLGTRGVSSSTTGPSSCQRVRLDDFSLQSLRNEFPRQEIGILLLERAIEGHLSLRGRGRKPLSMHLAGMKEPLLSRALGALFIHPLGPQNSLFLQAQDFQDPRKVRSDIIQVLRTCPNSTIVVQTQGVSASDLLLLEEFLDNDHAMSYEKDKTVRVDLMSAMFVLLSDLAQEQLRTLNPQLRSAEAYSKIIGKAAEDAWLRTAFVGRIGAHIPFF